VIWHFFEIWLFILAAFVVGCVLGTFAYGWLAGTRLAVAQGALADTVGDVIDGIKTRLGVGAAWRPSFRRAARPTSVVARRAGSVEPRFQRGGESGPGARRRGRPDRRDGLRRGEAADQGTDLAWDQDEEDELSVIADERGDDLFAETEPAADDFAQPADDIMPMRPASLAAPRNSVPDDLQRIRGIGRRNEELLNSLGIYHFGQIAAWTPGEARWVGAYLAFPERIERDDWIGQATILASGGSTGYVKAADRRKPTNEE
jgi:predicted flap endonuclease-1-like 5' DNA nuclease